MNELEALKAENNQLQIALDAAVEETKRLTEELVGAEETINVLTDLLRLLAKTWREGADLRPVIDEVKTTLVRLRRGH